MKQAQSRKYCFGPVPSRRLGRSLGIDFIPFKTCTYDCIYCQLGRTTNKTTTRREFFPADLIIEDIAETLPGISPPDYITLSGSGEPTLYSRIGDIIKGIKDATDVPVALLTNGSLFWIDKVRDAVQDADLIIPSLDAGDEQTFSVVNRPHPDISFDKMIKGIRSLRENFTGQLWLEVLLVRGRTDGEGELLNIKDCIDRIEPDRVQINTAVRTPAEDSVEAVDREKLQEIAHLFGTRAEVIADCRLVHPQGDCSATANDILEMLMRRPCSLEDISAGLDMKRNEAIKNLEELRARKLIQTDKKNDTVLYRARVKHEIIT